MYSQITIEDKFLLSLLQKKSTMVHINLIIIKEYKYTSRYSCCAYEWAVGKTYFCLHFCKLNLSCGTVKKKRIGLSTAKFYSPQCMYTKSLVCAKTIYYIHIWKTPCEENRATVCAMHCLYARKSVLCVCSYLAICTFYFSIGRTNKYWTCICHILSCYFLW